MIDQQLYFEAMVRLGYDSFSIEPDGTVWLGVEKTKEFVDPELVSEMVLLITSERNG